MTTLARPDLPKHHPQNIPLDRWTDGWLKLSVAGHTVASYIALHDHEKRERGWPVTRADMIAFLIEKGDVPAAGIDAAGPAPQI